MGVEIERHWHGGGVCWLVKGMSLSQC